MNFYDAFLCKIILPCIHFICSILGRRVNLPSFVAGVLTVAPPLIYTENIWRDIHRGHTDQQTMLPLTTSVMLSLFSSAAALFFSTTVYVPESS